MCTGRGYIEIFYITGPSASDARHSCMGCTCSGARDARGSWGVQVLERGMRGVGGCTGRPGARDARGRWGVQILEQGMRGIAGVYWSRSKGCEG